MTQNTLNYTNTATMNGSVGWRFDLGYPNTGFRFWSASFLNKGSSSVISASTNGGLGYLWISATNVVNQGRLLAGFGSEIKLTGSLIDLSRSYTEIRPVSALQPSVASSVNNLANTSFTPSPSIFDIFWGQGSVSEIPNRIWNGATATNGLNPFLVVKPCGVVDAPTTIGLLATTSASRQVTVLDPAKNFAPMNLSLTVTNSDGSTNNITFPTNVIRQAVFVSVFDTNITTEIRFAPSQNPTNFSSTAVVRLQYLGKDFISQGVQTNAVFLEDKMLSDPRFSGLYSNTVINLYGACSLRTYRPGNYNLSRTDPGSFALGFSGSTPVANNFFTQGDFGPFTNAYTLVNVSNTAYSAYLDNQFINQATLIVSNIPGRVRVYAGNLNLQNASIRAEGQVLIQASNLVNSAGAVVDCENLDYDLGSTNGYLNLTNLASVSVKRLYGPIEAWSATWNAIEEVVTPNYTFDTTLSNYVYSPLTNYANYTTYAMLVNATNLVTTVPVSVQNLTLHSTNIVVSDSVSLANKLLFDGQTLTLNGFLSVSNWTDANAPTLRHFTNNGSIYIPGSAYFGNGGPTNYLSFVNNGFIQSAGQIIRCSSLQLNSGSFDVATNYGGDLIFITQTSQLSGATIYCAGSINFTTTSLQLNTSRLYASNDLSLTVTGSLSDNGTSSFLYCHNGFNLWSKPATGNLLGTTITSYAAYGGAAVYHYWAGDTTGGYLNNAAIGNLILSPEGNSSLFPPLFVFSGTGAANAMYVSHLDLSLLNSLNEIQVNPNLTIYFQQASFNGTNGAENFLNNNSGGRLQHAASIPSSIVPGPNAANSQLQLLASYSSTSGVLQLKSSVDLGQTNIIEASTNLRNWTPIYTNIGSFTNFGPSTFADPAAASFPARFYRAVLSTP